MTQLQATLALTAPLFALPALAQNPLYEVRGATGEALGSGVLTLGDLDGDGLEEIGALFLPGAGLGYHTRVLRGADGSVLKTIQGRSVGDADADGLADRFVTTGPTSFGVASGDSGPLLWEVDLAPNSSPGISAVPHDLGDVDGDGQADLLVNEVWLDSNTGGVTFQTSIYSGASGALANRFVLDNGAYAGNFSWAVPVGDWSGDGITDLAIADDPDDLRVVAFDGAELARIPLLPQVKAWAGGELFAGDVDGDGVADFGFSDLSVFELDNRTYVQSGATGNLLLDVEGSACRIGGDVDGDGRNDLVTWSDWGVEVRSITGALLRRVEPTTFGYPWFPVTSTVGADTAPLFATTIGDLDGDGRDDLVVGEGYPAGTTDPMGRVRVFTGDWSDELGTRLAPTAAHCALGAGGAGTGCINETGAGASLAARGSSSALEANLAFAATGLPVASDAVLFSGTAPLGTPRPFGNGAFLLSGPYRRVSSHISANLGQYFLAQLGDTHAWISGPATAAGPKPFEFKLSWIPGQTYHLQAWYLAQPNGTANLTNAVQLTITP